MVSTNLNLTLKFKQQMKILNSVNLLSYNKGGT